MSVKTTAIVLLTTVYFKIARAVLDIKTQDTEHVVHEHGNLGAFTYVAKIHVTYGSLRALFCSMVTQLPSIPVVVVGGGFSGLATGAKLKMQLGLDEYVIYERSPDFGGTWWDNVCEEMYIYGMFVESDPKITRSRM